MLIPFPASPVPAKVEWAIDQPGQANRGEFTGTRRVTLLSAAPRWYAKVTLPQIRGEDRVLDWRAFVVDCDGIANRFRLIACERDQVPATTVFVRGGGQYGHQLLTAGWDQVGRRLRRGQMVTVNDQLLMLTGPVDVNEAGEALLSFKPYLRYVPADNLMVEVRRPYGVMAMSDPRNGWAADIGQSYAVAFDCEEAF